MTEKQPALTDTTRLLEWYNEKVRTHTKDKEMITLLKSTAQGDLTANPDYNYALGRNVVREELLTELGALLIAGTADAQGQLEPHMFATESDPTQS